MAAPREVMNCGQAPAGVVRFSFRCPAAWDELAPTDDPRRRRCARCDTVVHLCHDVIEAGVRADQGECIAVPGWLADGARAELGALAVGRATPSLWLRQAWDAREG